MQRIRSHRPPLCNFFASGLAAAALAVACLASPSPASANLYTIHPCSAGSPPPSIGPSFVFAELSFGEFDAARFDAGENCEAGGELILRGQGPSSTGSASWELGGVAPFQRFFSEIRSIEMDLAFPGAWGTSNGPTWRIFAGNAIEGSFHEIEQSRAPVPEEHATWAVTLANRYGAGELKEGTVLISMQIQCFLSACAAGSPVESISKIRKVVVNDLRQPIVTEESGSLFTQGATTSGRVIANVRGHDDGSGIFRSKLLIDGSPAEIQNAGLNGGRCKEPFTVFEPCAPDALFVYNIDTNNVSDGSHHIQLQVCDGSGACANTQEVTLNVHNAPTNQSPPAISGTARLGAALSASEGTWGSGAPLLYSFSWLRCPANVTNPSECTPIPGAEEQTYAPVAADLGLRMIAKVTATLETGAHTSAAAFSPPSEPVAPGAPPANTAPPTLTGTAKVGQRLATTNGVWENAPNAFTYQWLRCPPNLAPGSETGCTAITGATSAQYTPLTEDIGKRDLAKVSATNAFGSGTALSAPSEPVAAAPKGDTTPPTLSGLSLSRKSFRVGRGATAITAAAAAARGTILRFSSTEAGKLSVAITPLGARRRATKPLATLTRTINAGPGSLALSGRIGKKKMAPGRYRLTLTATDAAANRSAPASLSLRILSG